MTLAIEIQSLSKFYPGTQALNKLSFNVEKGSVHGLLGPNGAGKSTTINILAGLTQQSSGRALVMGEDISLDPKVIQGQLGLLLENPPLYLDMVVGDYLHFVAEIQKVPRAMIKSRLKVLMEKTGIESVQKRLIGNLSKGYKQRVGIAQALVGSPHLLILDEPTANLDPGSIIEIRQLIESLKGEHTILLSTHQLHEVQKLCSAITVVNRGEAVVSGSLSEVMEKFSTQSVLEATVSVWDKKREENLIQQTGLGIATIEEQKTPAGFIQLRLFLKVKDERRAEIIQQLVQLQCGLVEFKGQILELEDVFMELMEVKK